MKILQYDHTSVIAISEDSAILPFFKFLVYKANNIYSQMVDFYFVCGCLFYMFVSRITIQHPFRNKLLSLLLFQEMKTHITSSWPK